MFILINFFFHSSMDGGPVGEELIVLLEFAMARGSLGSILDALKLLLGKMVLVSSSSIKW